MYHDMKYKTEGQLQEHLAPVEGDALYLVQQVTYVVMALCDRIAILKKRVENLEIKNI